MKKLKETENILVLGIFLGICAAIAALVLAKVDDMTREPIKKMKMQAVNNALKEVLPAFDNSPGNNTFVKDGITFYGAMKDGQLVAVAASGVSMKGYSGKIVAMIGLKLDGSIRKIAADKKLSAVLITEQKETPGLGTVVCERKRQKTIISIFEKPGKDANLPPKNKILDQFADKIAGSTPWKVTKDGGKFDYMTGATISSKAVTGVVYKIARTYVVNSKEIIKELAKAEK